MVEYEVRRKQDSERKRIKVLQQAGYCFAQRGYKKTTMEQVADRAKVSKGLVFHFYGSKQSLFEAVVEDALNQWSTLSEYRALDIEGDSLAELRSLFLTSFDYVEQNPVLLLFSRQEQGLAKNYRQAFVARNRRWRLRVEKVVNDGVARGEIKEIDTVGLAFIFHQLQTALLTGAGLANTPQTFDRATVELAIDVFLRGIQSASSG